MFIDMGAFDLLPYPFNMMSQPRTQSQRWKETKRSIFYRANHFILFLCTRQHPKQICMHKKKI